MSSSHLEIRADKCKESPQQILSGSEPWTSMFNEPEPTSNFTGLNFLLDPQGAGADVVVSGQVDLYELPGGSDTNPEGHDWFSGNGNELGTFRIGASVWTTC